MKLRRASAVGLAISGLFLLTLGVGLTAANAVSGSGAGRSDSAISAEDLKPAQCSALTLTNVVTGNNGTSGGDLMTGDAGSNNMKGRNGTDCLIGGDGDDSLDGGPGDDVCIGGAGTNTYANCETII